MVWLDEPEERKRILMDLHVMSNHKSPHIVQYYGSAIWNVSQHDPSALPSLNSASCIQPSVTIIYTEINYVIQFGYSIVNINLMV